MVGLLSEDPGWLNIVGYICTLYAVIFIPVAVLMAFLERKIGADLQARIGPNQVGPGGMFQPVADFFKGLQKELTLSRKSRSEDLWLGVLTMALYSTVAVLPLGSAVLLIDAEMSTFIPFWAAMVLALGTVLLGFDQRFVSGWFGGVRVMAQALAGMFPALVTLLSVGLHSGSFRWSVMSEVQTFSPLGWTALANPFLALAFLVFFVSGLVLLSVPPLDSGLYSFDIHGGVSGRMFGRRLTLFRIGRFYGLFLWSVLTIVIFCGGWNLPAFLSDSLRQSDDLVTLSLLEFLVLFLKTAVLIVLISLIGRVIPRIRVDQITDMAWKVLGPFALLSLLGTAVWKGWSAL